MAMRFSRIGSAILSDWRDPPQLLRCSQHTPADFDEAPHMGERPDEPTRYGPMTITLVAFLGLAAASLPLLPESLRPYNFAAFGALGLFAAGRLNLALGFLLCIGGKLLSDSFNVAAFRFQPDYLPMWKYVLPFAIYPICGRVLKPTANPLAIGGMAIFASVLFFLVSNFEAWLGQAMPYPYTFAGLMECYAMGLPFYKGTLLGDVAITCGIFAAHAYLAKIYFPAEAVKPAAVEVER